jgi:S-adenosylmethionine hydrolase
MGGPIPGRRPVPVVLLTDFGLDDHYTGVMHAVLEREAPGVPRLDLMHTVPPGDIWAACFHLGCAWSHLPPDAVVLAVVDPGVGTDRRAVAVRLGQRWLVAPDNGLAAAAGEPDHVRILDWRRMDLAEPSATFHGRDLFAPAAARLAAGADPAAIGPELSPGALIASPLPAPRHERSRIVATVLHVDRFGNVITNLPAARLGPGAVVRAGGRELTHRAQTYGDAEPGTVVLLSGSSGHLELALNRGSAAQVLGLLQGSELEVWPEGRVSST